MFQFCPIVIVAAFLLIAATACAAAQGQPRPTPEQAAWQDYEIGMFIHYDLPVFKPGWHHRDYDHFPRADIFNPTRLDTDQWMQAAAAMGARYAVLTATHGSGFMLWQSEAYAFGVKQSPWKGGKGDLVKEYVASCRKAGLSPGLYCHMLCNGWWEADHPGLVNRGKGGDAKRQAEYAAAKLKQAQELWGNYGPLGEIWFDGGTPDPAAAGFDVVPLVRKLQPKAMVFQSPAATIRWIGNESGVAAYPCWATVADFKTASRGEGDLGSGDPNGQAWLPGECDVPIRKGQWLWEPNGERLLNSVDELMDCYYKSVGRNCNLLLNVNPDPDGLVPPADMKRIKEFGDEIRRRFSRPLAQTAGEGETVELALDTPGAVNHVIIMEKIAEGERIRQYVVEGFTGGAWKELCKGSSVGHKRIEQFPDVQVSKVRLRATRSTGRPLIRQLSVHNVTPRDNSAVK